MPKPPELEGVEFDDDSPLMDREQIDMLLMVEEGEDSSALVKELFSLFKEESDVKMEELAQACAGNDRMEVRKIVHFVAGSAGNLGLTRLAKFYRAVERAIDEGRVYDVSGFEGPIREEYLTACQAFAAEFGI